MADLFVGMVINGCGHLALASFPLTCSLILVLMTGTPFTGSQRSHLGGLPASLFGPNNCCKALNVLKTALGSCCCSTIN